MQSNSEEEDEDETTVTPFSHARPSKGSDNDSENSERSEKQAASDDEEAFIVEDDNTVELPAAFSMSTHQDLKHHFKIICQLFVHLAVQHPGDRRSFMEDSMKCNSTTLQLSYQPSILKPQLYYSRIFLRTVTSSPSEAFRHARLTRNILSLATTFQETSRNFPQIRNHRFGFRRTRL